MFWGELLPQPEVSAPSMKPPGPQPEPLKSGAVNAVTDAPPALAAKFRWIAKFSAPPPTATFVWSRWP